MTARELLASLHRLLDRHPEDWDLELRIRTSDPGIPAPFTVGVSSVGEGFDWTNGKLLIFPDQPITTKAKASKS